jgi:hypothetical protein
MLVVGRGRRVASSWYSRGCERVEHSLVQRFHEDVSDGREQPSKAGGGSQRASVECERGRGGGGQDKRISDSRTSDSRRHREGAPWSRPSEKTKQQSNKATSKAMPLDPPICQIDLV